MAQWTVQLPEQGFTSLLGDPEFRTIVKLARAANSVLFCQLLLLEERDDDSPEGLRRRLNALLYLGPVIYEAMDLARNQLGRHLRSYPAFGELFKPLFRDKEIPALVEGPLKRVRNAGVFHFSSDSIPDGLISLKREEFDFLVAKGNSIRETYYALADEAVLHAAFDVNGSPREVYEQLRPLIKRTLDLSARFLEAAERLIGEVLLAKGWKVRIGAEDARSDI